MNCVQSKDLLFDFVYGLLDEPEANALREHVAGCPACAAVLEKAKTDQGKIARAALAVGDVAPFQLPSERVVAETTPLPALEPVAPPAAPRRRFRAITAIAWAATCVCGVLVAVLMVNNHRERLGEHESRVANLTRQQDALDVQLASLHAKLALEQDKLPTAVNKDAVQLHVAGPGSVTPGVTAGYRVALRDLDGKAKSGKVEVDFVDDKNRSVARRTVEMSDQVDLPVPAELSTSPGALRMRMVAKTGDKTVATLEESIVSQQAELAAHVAVNKILYKAGDRVQLRALALDRVTLKPAPVATKVVAALLDDAGKLAAPPIELLTLAGMAAGEIPLRADLPEGNYTLETRVANGAPVRRVIEVLPAVAPSVEIYTQNAKARPGEALKNYIQFWERDGTPAANVPVTSNSVVADQKFDANNQRGGDPRANNEQRDNNFANVGNAQNSRTPFINKGMTDANGKYALTIPGVKDANTGRQQLNIDLVYGAGQKEKAQVKVELQVQPSQVAIDFYPEGGQLIAGMANRVFYRVRAPEGDASASASFSIHSSKKPLFNPTPEASVGSFEITPDPNETYTVKVASPKQDDIANPFSAHPVRTEGLLLRGPTVQIANQPIHLTLENRGPERLVQLIAMCRGQVVAHTRLSLSAPKTPVDLPLDVDGVIRVTAFDVKDGRLAPLTERLFFRPARYRLDIGVEARTDKKNPAAPVNLSIKALDEKKTPIAFWGMASVVDDRFRGEVAEPSLSSHFLLLGEAPADVDLSELPLISLDEALNKKDLDLTLGLFGWRRLSPAANPALIANAQKIEAGAGNMRPAANGASFFYRVEPSLFQIKQKLDEQWQISQLALMDAAQKQKAELAQKRTDLASALVAARTELEQASRLPREQLMTGLGVAALGLIAIGALCMMYGLSRLLRRLPAAGSFGTACGCLAACLAILVFRPQDDPREAVGATVAEAKLPNLKDFTPKSRTQTRLEKSDAPPTNGQVTLEEKAREAAPFKAADREMVQADAQQEQRPAMARRFADAAPGDVIARADFSRNSLVRTLKEGEMKRGGPAAAKAPDRSVALVPQPYGQAPGGVGGGGGFGGAPPNASAGFAGGAPAPKTIMAEPKTDVGGPGFARPSVAMPMPESAKSADVAKGDSMKANSAKRPPQPPANIAAQAMPAQRADTMLATESPWDLLAKKQLGDQRDRFVQRIDVGAMARQFVPRRSGELSDPATLLWVPGLSVPTDGTLLQLDLPASPARYRVHIFGHTDDGRLGVYDGLLNAK